MKQFFIPEVLWFVIGLVLMLMEISAPGLIIVFFGIGAWIVALLCLFLDIGINVQLFVFIVASILSLLLLRRKFKDIFLGRVEARRKSGQDDDAVVGQKATVTSEIKPDRRGKVEFHGVSWDAEAETDIPTGVTVEIVGKRSITLLVKKADEKQEKEES